MIFEIWHESDDYAVWPDGTWAVLGDVWKGDYNWMSDDFEVICHNDLNKLNTLIQIAIFYIRYLKVICLIQ